MNLILIRQPDFYDMLEATGRGLIDGFSDLKLAVGGSMPALFDADLIAKGLNAEQMVAGLTADAPFPFRGVHQ